jgi:hypothetical protein
MAAASKGTPGEVPESDRPVDRTQWGASPGGCEGREHPGPCRSRHNRPLEVHRLGQRDRGMIGLWTGNNSDGAFPNLRIRPMK